MEDFVKALYNTLNNGYKQVAPANARLYLKSFTNPTNVNENNFTQQELDVLKDAYRKVS